ncbi:MAG: RNA methyltransferase [Clostridiaceae bacterium]|nr:RNA methyltransferase [Clostridiaceae bacterium]
MQLIESSRNKTIKYIFSLKNKTNRRKQQSFLIEGFRFVREALLSGIKVEIICFSTETGDESRKEIQTLTNKEIKYILVPPALFARLSETDTPQGILAVADIPDSTLYSIYRKGFRGVLMDSVQDPGNAGTIIRSAHALGFDAVITTKGAVDIYNGKVLRSTAGSVFHIPVVDGVEDEEVFRFCKEHDIRIITTGLNEGKPCYECDLSGDFLLAIGNEGRGVSEKIKQMSLASAFIPMPGGAESLNAGVAASIIMYESNRQRFSV